jgi:hypothetical protein
MDVHIGRCGRLPMCTSISLGGGRVQSRAWIAGLTASQRTSFDAGWGGKFGHDLGLVLTGARDPARSRADQGLHRHPDLEMQ